MATEAQIRANRANARMSTGPKSDEGKKTAARNAIKHGMAAAEAVVLPNELEIYDAFREAILAEHNPQTPTETVLVDAIIAASWTLHRCRMAEIKVFDDTSDATIDPLVCNSADLAMRRIDIYMRRAESSLHRSIRTLQLVRKERLAHEAALESSKPRFIQVEWVKPKDDDANGDPETKIPPEQTKPIPLRAPLPKPSHARRTQLGPRRTA
jgi:hypothetical protein